MSKPSNSSTTLLLARQLDALVKKPGETGFSVGKRQIFCLIAAGLILWNLKLGLVDESNLYEWKVLIFGPPDTIYEGGFFQAKLFFPPEFPLLPPKMQFTTEMWHPNIYPDGTVCISILHAPGEDQYGYEDAGERWMPVHSVESILISVISLLSSDTPNLDSPANVDAAKQVRTDLAGYKKKVRRLVRKSADEAFD